MRRVRALLAVEAGERASGSYHIASASGARSLCGTVDAESPFAAQTYRALSGERAERLGLERCGRCEAVADSADSA